MLHRIEKLGICIIYQHREPLISRTFINLLLLILELLLLLFSILLLLLVLIILPMIFLLLHLLSLDSHAVTGAESVRKGAVAVHALVY
jgi:uncharacterized BrkB/YihY/UPF0761 family membrane protein